MINIVKSAIERIYIKGDYDFFRRKCNIEMDMPKQIEEHILSNKYKLEDISEGNKVSKTWFINMGDYTKGEFSVTYIAKLQVSKITPIYYMQNGFSVVNMDEDCLEERLIGYDISDSYCKKQMGLLEIIESTYSEMRYKQIYYSDMREVPKGINLDEWDKNISLQPKVEVLLFNDPYKICLE